MEIAKTSNNSLEVLDLQDCLIDNAEPRAWQIFYQMTIAI